MFAVFKECEILAIPSDGDMDNSLRDERNKALTTLAPGIVESSTSKYSDAPLPPGVTDLLTIKKHLGCPIQCQITKLFENPKPSNDTFT
ncbi:hypothetical protein BV898_05236 [Hypsibius exemplaris]|uniref:Uncharacterized protein n=1 Tax=Hypsibius exemplaris TaxID=2072580 RepID=A0A1W0X094_HYPEX|nr:hypothetical protein BV898_05236 [Hypsibius exemplaris]